MKKLLTIGLLLTMLSMPNNVNAQRFLDRVNNTLERVSQTLEQVQEATPAETPRPNDTRIAPTQQQRDAETQTAEIVATTVTAVSSGFDTNDGIIVMSDRSEVVVLPIHRYRNRQNTPANIEHFHSGEIVLFEWGVPTGGCPGGVTYQWQQSSNGRTWTNVGTARTFHTQPITADTYFRRLATDDCGVTFSTIMVRITLDRTVWATRNVGMPGTFVDNPQDPGRLYQWNRRTAWPITGDVTGWDNRITRITETWAVNDPCPEGWRVPTRAEFEALSRHISEWVYNWNNTGINGRLFGTAPNQIFLPAVVTRDRSGRLNYTRNQPPGGVYWSSSYVGEVSIRAISFGVRSSNIQPLGSAYDIHRGHSIRCVREIPYTPQQPVTPPTQEASTPTSLDDGVVINGVRWATRNVDAPGTFAATPESAGMFFQWNRRRGWDRVEWDDSNPAGTSWTRENDPCPQGWRVPTENELRSLMDADSEWTTRNGVYGRYFGSTPHRIFLPAVNVYNYSEEFQTQSGGYWSSTRFWEDIYCDEGMSLWFYPEFVGGVGGFRRREALSVRCVAE